HCTTTSLHHSSDDIQHYTADDCQVTPVIHVLQYPGCVPKPIPSFACVGRCASYIQVSGSKIWQMERSCMCCQESGEREASVSLFCPKAKNGEKKFKKVWRILIPRGVGELFVGVFWCCYGACLNDA
ncbi:bursicon, partial [Culex pipiens pallens]|uniref:bursicon n=1 Tax=Culex pipiens pallens TaxID=42434 RepID=UPI0022AA892E